MSKVYKNRKEKLGLHEFDIAEIKITGHKAGHEFDKCIVEGTIKEWNDRKWRKFRIVMPTSFKVKEVAEYVCVNYKKLK